MLRNLSVLLFFLASLFVSRAADAQSVQIGLRDDAGNSGSITMNFATYEFTADMPGATQVTGRFDLAAGEICLTYRRGDQYVAYGCFFVENGDWVFRRESNGVIYRITSVR